MGKNGFLFFRTSFYTAVFLMIKAAAELLVFLILLKHPVILASATVDLLLSQYNLVKGHIGEI